MNNNILESLIVPEGEREVLGRFGDLKVYAPNSDFYNFLQTLMESHSDKDDILDPEMIRQTCSHLTNLEELDKSLLEPTNFAILLARGKSDARMMIEKVATVLEEEAIKLGERLKRINNLPDSARKVVLEKLINN